MFRKRRERTSALGILIDLVSTLIAVWFIFTLKLIRGPVYPYEPVTIFQYIVHVIQSLLGSLG